jgi:hypothetical protein
MKYFISAFCFSLCVNAFASKGNGAGGGTDTMKDPYAWFVGPERTIRSCVYMDPRFGVTKQFAIKEIYSAYQSWQKYIEKKQLSFLLGNLPLMTTKIQINETCTGLEDLTFYFGVEDGKVKKAKQHYNKPYGIAERLKFDPETSWSKGFIWIAMPGSVIASSGKLVPNWKLPYTLHGILMHEIGHTLGNEHVPGTIMQENFGYNIESQDEAGTNDVRLRSIDGSQELHVCRTCGTTFVTNEGLFVGHLKALMEEVTGQPVVGRPQAEFVMEMDARKLPIGTITYQDERSKYTFSLRSIAGVSSSGNWVRPFNILVKTEEGSFISTFGNSAAYVYTAILEGMGKKRSVIFSRNASGRAGITDAMTGKQLFWSERERED